MYQPKPTNLSRLPRNEALDLILQARADRDRQDELRAQRNRPWTPRTRLLVSLACLVAGALLGYALLAAIPRFRETPSDAHYEQQMRRDLAGSGSGNSLYGVLGVPPDAGAGDIRAAYHRLSRDCHHPDRVSAARGSEEKVADALEQQLRVQGAYEVLGDGLRRCKYDYVSGSMGYAWYQRCRRAVR